MPPRKPAVLDRVPGDARLPARVARRVVGPCEGGGHRALLEGMVAGAGSDPVKDLVVELRGHGVHDVVVDPRSDTRAIRLGSGGFRSARVISPLVDNNTVLSTQRAEKVASWVDSVEVLARHCHGC